MLPPLIQPATGFTASFDFGIQPPASGSPADGFGFYFKPASASVDVASNQVGGYAEGLGVEFITFGGPRIQVRLNNTVLPEVYPFSPPVDGNFHEVVIDFRGTGGQPGNLVVTLDGVRIIQVSKLNFAPGSGDLFAFTARTGAFAQTTALDNIRIAPLQFRPVYPTLFLAQPGPGVLNMTLLDLNSSNLVHELSWDTVPNAIYDLESSTDLLTWDLVRSYTAADTTQVATQIDKVDRIPRLFYRVGRKW